MLALDEHLTWYQPVGALVVLVGVAVSQGLLASRKRPTPAPLTPAELAVDRARRASAAQSTSWSAGQVLTTRSAGTPHSAARSQP